MDEKITAKEKRRREAEKEALLADLAQRSPEPAPVAARPLPRGVNPADAAAIQNLSTFQLLAAEQRVAADAASSEERRAALDKVLAPANELLKLHDRARRAHAPLIEALAALDFAKIKAQVPVVVEGELDTRNYVELLTRAVRDAASALRPLYAVQELVGRLNQYVGQGGGAVTDTHGAGLVGELQRALMYSAEGASAAASHADTARGLLRKVESHLERARAGEGYAQIHETREEILLPPLGGAAPFVRARHTPDWDPREHDHRTPDERAGVQRRPDGAGAGVNVGKQLPETSDDVKVV